MVDAISRFLESHMETLRRCYKPYAKPSEASKKKFEDAKNAIFKESTLTIGSIDTKLKEEAEKLSKTIQIEEIEALKIVLQIDSKGLVDEELRFEYFTRKFLSERRYMVKLVNLLCKIRSTEQSGVWKKYSTDILVEENFFEGLIGQISDNMSTDDIPGGEIIRSEVSAIPSEARNNGSGQSPAAGGKNANPPQTSIWHLELLDLCFTAVCSLIPTTNAGGLMEEWLGLIDRTGFFTDNIAKFSNESQMSISALSLSITLAFLNVDLNVDFGVGLDGLNESYLRDVGLLIRIHDIVGVRIIDYSAGSPLLLAWSFILHKFSLILMGEEGEESGLSFDDSRYDLFFKRVLPKYQVINDDNRLTAVEDLGLYAGELASHAIRLDGFVRLAELFDYLPKGVEYASICANLLLSSLPYVNMTEPIAKVVYKITSGYHELKELFMMDAFGERCLVLCKAKVPIAINPFLILGKCLDGYAYQWIADMTSFMQELPKGFRDYDFVSVGGGKQSQIELTSELCLFESRMEDGQGGFVLPIGTRGDLISTGSNTGTSIVMWNYQYNGWTLLGRMLEENRTWDNSSDSGLIVNILSIINSTLKGLIGTKQFAEAHDLLLSLSQGLGQSDITGLITKKLEDSFYNRNRNIEICILGVQFLTILVDMEPKRVWPYLGRTKLLESNGRGGYLGTILGAIEIVNNDFEFTISIIDLVATLVHNCLLNSLDTTISVKVKSEVLTEFIRHLIQVFESFSYWRYNKEEQRIKIATRILDLFSLIIHSTYRADGESQLADKVTFVLGDASLLITSEFLSPNEGTTRPLSTLLGAIESAAKSVSLSSGGRTNLLDDDELRFIDIVLQFSSLLVRVRSIMKLPCSYLERELYRQSPHLVLIFLRYASLHSPVINVLQSIINGYWPDEQPSLLAHLGTQYSQVLIGCLSSSIRNNLELDLTLAEICDYFSTIIESKQEGLSILLLSGKDTSTKKDTSDKAEKVASLLTVLEEKVTSSGMKLPEYLADRLLNSISLAHSTWTLNAAEDKSNLCKVLIEYIKDSKSIETALAKATDSIPINTITQSYKISIAAKATTILSIHLFKTPKGLGSKSFLDFLGTDNNLVDLSKSFLIIQGFRPSLHGNLKRNFDKKYPKAPLEKYISTVKLLPPNTRPYGSNYLYDLGLLNTVLGDDPVWIDGYHNEIVEANINLSFVDSQMSRVKSWCSFLTSLVLTTNSQTDRNLLEKLNSVASIAIEANFDDNRALSFFRGIIKLRLELAFFIIYNLSRANMNLTTEHQLTSAFKLLADPYFLNLNDIEQQLPLEGADDQPIDQPLYKQLFRIINLQLSNLQLSSDIDFRLLQTIHGILDIIVIRGMKSIATAIQSKPTSSGVEDMVQITMILRKCLKIPGIASLYPYCAQLMVESGCDQAVMDLFAYSSELCINNKDPIFGELALVYLLQWLSVDMMADTLVGGLLNVLTESPIARSIQQGIIKSTTDSRLFAIWSKGMLTIVLELLKQLGARIIPEVIVFLKFYSIQIDNALKYWLDSQVLISLSNIEETYQLYLLITIVKKLADPDQARVIPQFSNKNDIIDSLDYFLTHHRYLSSRIVSTTIEEQKLSLESRDDNNALVAKVTDQLAELRDFLADNND